MSNITNPFALAARNKLRFATNSGHVAAEDLFDLSLKSLDKIAVGIHSGLQEDSTSFLSNPDRQVSEAQKEQELRLEVLKAVIGIKQDENKEKLDALSKSKRREFLKGLQEKKRMETLESLSEEEIAAQLAELDGETPDSAETAVTEEATAAS